MSVTRLKRKDRKNKARANNRVARIKQLTKLPVVKIFDIEELKAKFAPAESSVTAPAKAAKVAEPVAQAPAPAPVVAQEATATAAAEDAPAQNTEA